MEHYRVLFSNLSGKITADFEFHSGAEIDTERLTGFLSKACDDQGSGFELWRGKQVIAGRKPLPNKTRRAGPRSMKSLAVGAAAVLVFGGSFFISRDHLWTATSPEASPVNFGSERQNATPADSKIRPNLNEAGAYPVHPEPSNEAMRRGYADYQRIILGSDASDEPTTISRSKRTSKQSVRNRHEKKLPVAPWPPRSIWPDTDYLRSPAEFC